MDRIEIRGRPLDTIGGSGFITALAARLTGVSVGLIARVPTTLPDQIAAAFNPGGIDPGGLVPVEGSLPGFHISYDEAESATYLMIASGVEGDVSAADVPSRWLNASWVHVGPLAASAAQQLRFVEDLLARGYRGGLSAGTFSRAVTIETDVVRELFDRVDIAFLNGEEADEVYPASTPNRTILCVTRGRDGMSYWDGATWSHHSTVGVVSMDPTGAGDAFVGGHLGAMITGDPEPHLTGLRIASLIVEGPGAAPLLARIPDGIAVGNDHVDPVDGATTTDRARIEGIGSRLRNAAGSSALTFCGSPFPEQDDPVALEVLALATLHQYGFWEGSVRGYEGPMWSKIDGVRRKGSDFLWAAFTRAAADDPGILDPSRLAIDPLLFDTICVDDEGRCPIPDVGSHRVLQQGYGEAIGRLGGVPSLIEASNSTPDPLAAFLKVLTGIPGYGEDPLAKKANLLALILANRPERFLDLRGPMAIAPIIDYHIMRTMLRTGCVRVEAEALRRSLEARTWVEAGDESAIRIAARDAIDALCTASGLRVGEVDGFLFNLGRTVCLENETPRCAECPLEPACAGEVDLFQPIFRTTAY